MIMHHFSNISCCRACKAPTTTSLGVRNPKNAKCQDDDANKHTALPEGDWVTCRGVSFGLGALLAVVMPLAAGKRHLLWRGRICFVPLVRTSRYQESAVAFHQVDKPVKLAAFRIC